MTRRTFLSSTTAAAAAAATGLSAQTPLETFPYGSVQLLDGPLRAQFDQTHSFFLSLSEDRLLKIYRQRTGLSAPGENMGGWYDDFCPGAHFGQYVSALARFAAITGSAATREKTQRLVRGYAETLHGSANFFDDLRYPAYTYDKIVCMLIDAHQCAGETQAASILQATTKAAVPHMPERALTLEEQHTRPHKDETYTWDETYTLAENLFLASERLGDPAYRDMGRRYLLDNTFFDPLSQNQNVLPGLHAYSHMNALSSGMQGYLKLGDAKYLKAVRNAVNMIWDTQSFATGGWGPNEAFVEPGKGLLGASLNETHRSFETPCGAYAHFKAMRYLLSVTRDARYGDSLEKVLYNTVLGAKPVREDGSSFYYSDYHHSAQKTYKRVIPGAKYSWDRDGRWPCCSGTLPQVVADYTISAYLRGQDGVYVNLYVPSRLKWSGGGTEWAVTQNTQYPVESLISLRIEPSRASELALHLRVPAWAGPHSAVSVNGKRVHERLQPGTFFALRRVWKSGDTVELELDQRVTALPVDRATPDQVALVRGPLVLFAIADNQPGITQRQIETVQPVKAGNGDWTLQGVPDSPKLRPFYAIGDEIYQTYWKRS